MQQQLFFLLHYPSFVSFAVEFQGHVVATAKVEAVAAGEIRAGQPVAHHQLVFNVLEICIE